MNSGAQVNVAVKSGTNGFHGTLFEFVRNDRFDARGFFLPPNQPKNKLRRNQYGAVASGPIRKDKTFWLFNWDARRERRATVSSGSAPRWTCATAISPSCSSLGAAPRWQSSWLTKM